MGGNGKAVASIVCACATACAKSGTAWKPLHHGSAIDWEPDCTKCASGCGMNAGVTGEKMNSRCTVNAVVGPLPAARPKQKAIRLSVSADGRKVRSVGRHRLDKVIVLL